MAALLIYGHYNLSSTDQACAWNAPKIKPVDKVVSLKQLHPFKKTDYSPVDEIVVEKMSQLKKVVNRNVVGVAWTMRKVPLQEFLYIVPQIEEILFSSEYVNAENKRQFICEKCRISEEVREKLVTLTIGQSNNEIWLVARKHRLTASKFGQILLACRRKKFPPSLFKNLLEGYDLSGIKAIQWGMDNEPMAIASFSTATELEVVATGLWLHTCGFLGASPDGLVGTDAIVEIKCPYKYRSASLKEGLLKDKLYIIYRDVEDGPVIVNEAHHYWHQIQGQLHILNRSKCYLVVWTPGEIEIVVILKATHWEQNILILENFFFDHFIPNVSGLPN